MEAAKETEAALNNTVEDINRKLEAGEFKGEDGVVGSDGFSPVITTKDITTGYEVEITDAEGTEKIILLHGKDGADGTMSFEDLTEEQRESLKGDKGDKGDQGEQGEQGPEGPQGPAGVDGNDYILTSDDKTEIANEVYAMFTNAEEVSF